MKEFTFSVTNKELQIISVALGNMPYSDVNALIGKIQSQINEQAKNDNT